MNLKFVSVLLLVSAASHLDCMTRPCLAQNGATLRLLEISWGYSSITNVPLDAKVAFRFSKPVRLVWDDQPFVSSWIAYDLSHGFPRQQRPDFDGNKVIYSYTSSSNRSTIACSYPGGWPALSEVVLEYTGAYIQDLEGNRLGETGRVGFETGSKPIPTLVLSPVQAQPLRPFHLEFASYPGVLYIIQASSNVADATRWQTVWSGRAPGDLLSFTDSGQNSHSFFRVHHE